MRRVADQTWRRPRQSHGHRALRLLAAIGTIVGGLSLVLAGTELMAELGQRKPGSPQPAAGHMVASYKGKRPNIPGRSRSLDMACTGSRGVSGALPDVQVTSSSRIVQRADRATPSSPPRGSTARGSGRVTLALTAACHRLKLRLARAHRRACPCGRGRPSAWAQRRAQASGNQEKARQQEAPPQEAPQQRASPQEEKAQEAVASEQGEGAAHQPANAAHAKRPRLLGLTARDAPIVSPL